MLLLRYGCVGLWIAGFRALATSSVGAEALTRDVDRAPECRLAG